MSEDRKRVYLIRPKNREPLAVEQAQLQELLAPLTLEGDLADRGGLRVDAQGVVATVNRIKQGLVVSFDPELELDEVESVVEQYLEELGSTVGQELEMVEL